ncbi:TetR/AcrR family transcriptional regulator [Dactylosporangium sp. CS-033363]|uniref:TetR/AcrR family transcriptional regulator n=1 Tax=Dactylosporangium sp. CS-033363 TaxID=3239935 RepID=UPI003D93C183
MTEPEAKAGRRRGSARGEAARTAILEQAARLFAEKGFEGTSLLDIAQAADLTRPALYHYFASKDEILATLVEQESAGAAGKLREIARSEQDPTARLRAAVHELVLDRADAPNRFRMLDRSETALPEPIAERHIRAKRESLSAMTTIIADGIRTGEFRPADERITAFAVIGMCNWVAWWYHPGRDPEPKAVAASIAESAVAMLARPEHARPSEQGVHGAIARLRADLDHLSRLVDEG